MGDADNGKHPYYMLDINTRSAYSGLAGVNEKLEVEPELAFPCRPCAGSTTKVPFDLTTVKPVPKSHEPPAYAVVFVDPEQVTVHFHDYLDRRTLVKVGDHFEYAR
jgi:hypothetical protein